MQRAAAKQAPAQRAVHGGHADADAPVVAVDADAEPEADGRCGVEQRKVGCDVVDVPAIRVGDVAGLVDVADLAEALDAVEDDAVREEAEGGLEGHGGVGHGCRVVRGQGDQRRNGLG